MSKKKAVNNQRAKTCAGFSMIELLVSIGMTIVILGVAVASFSGALSMRERESSRTDALTSVQAAINILSREISNSGYGLDKDETNGIVTEDSNKKRLRIRANTVNTYPSNTDTGTTSRGEDITYFYDAASQSVVRYDPVTGASGVINRVSDVDFQYYDYDGTTLSGPFDIPTKITGRVEITLTVLLPDVPGQPKNQTVTFKTDVTLRNSRYHLGQY